MTAEADAAQERRTALLEAASGVFKRYGFKKTSMDDLARAAGISRQGLYLHFPTKEALFREVVGHMLTRAKQAGRAALAREQVSPEERLYGAFEVGIGDHQQSEHISELIDTANALAGELLYEIEKSFAADLARVIKSTGVAAGWEKAGITAKDLAEHLQTTSYGLKHRRLSRAEYLERMRTAVRIVCRGGARK